MNTTDFRYGWKFAKGEYENAMQPEFDDTVWDTVIVPHTWNASDMLPDKNNPYIGPAYYRKKWHHRISDATKRYHILFEGIANHSKVWVDESYVGGRLDGFLPFRIDITDALNDSDEHTICVRGDNSFRTDSVPPYKIDWQRYGGMYRPVWLLEKASTYFAFKSILIDTPSVSRNEATVVIRSRVSELVLDSRALTVKHRLLAPDGTEICSAQQDITVRFGCHTDSEIELPKVADPLLWSPDTPHLYQVESTLIDNGTILDLEMNPLGFRWFRFDTDKGFLLNDTPIKLQGADIHQDFPGLGNATPDRFHYADMHMMKDAGFNFMRTSHYPRNERCLDYCDKLGILVMEEQPFWHGSLRSFQGEEFIQTTRSILKDMVEYHYNHPSIIIWNTVNEIMLTPPTNVEHAKIDRDNQSTFLHKNEWHYAFRAISVMNDVLHETDPHRPTCLVIGGRWRENDDAQLTRITDLVAYNGGAFNTTIEKTIAVEGKGPPVIDHERKLYPKRKAIMSEGIVNYNSPPMRAHWKSEMEHWKLQAGFWSIIYERDWFPGGAMWVFADYPADNKYRNMGIVDFSRLPYEPYFFYKSQWTESPMVHIVCHWDWPGSESKKREVAIFTNCNEVELQLNGNTLGKKNPNTHQWPHLPHPPIVWEVEYQPGTLCAIGSKDGETVHDTRITSGTPSKISLTTETDTIAADGQDISFITVTIVDKDGNRCYNEERTITIAVDGACACCGDAQIQVHGGLARFAIRSNGNEDDAVVTVTSDNLEKGTIKVAARSEK